MQKVKKLYEGKAKIIYATQDKNLVILSGGEFLRVLLARAIS